MLIIALGICLIVFTDQKIQGIIIGIFLANIVYCTFWIAFQFYLVLFSFLSSGCSLKYAFRTLAMAEMLVSRLISVLR